MAESWKVPKFKAELINFLLYITGFNIQSRNGKKITSKNCRFGLDIILRILTTLTKVVFIQVKISVHFQPQIELMSEFFCTYFTSKWTIKQDQFLGRRRFDLNSDKNLSELVSASANKSLNHYSVLNYWLFHFSITKCKEKCSQKNILHLLSCFLRDAFRFFSIKM